MLVHLGITQRISMERREPFSCDCTIANFGNLDSCSRRIEHPKEKISYETEARCSKGKLKRIFCCAANCEVCGGPTCSGICCHGAILKLGRFCEHAHDVSCMFPRRGHELESNAAWCSKRKLKGSVCCEATCEVCGGLQERHHGD